MSIQIGNTQTTVNNLVTTRERVILKSSAFSNLINLSTTLNSNLITLDQYAFGRVASNFNLYEGLGVGSPILIQYNKTGTIAYTPFNVQNLLTASTANVTGAANIGTTNTSNLVAVATADVLNATPFFSVKQNNGANIFTIAPNATTSFIGNVGIGTALPAAPLHVQTDALVSGTLTVGNTVLANTFQSPGLIPHSIVIQSGINNGITLNGKTTVAGDFVVTGNQTFTQDINFINAYVSGFLQTNQFSISNVSGTAFSLNRSHLSNYNLIEVTASNEPVFYISPSGWVGVGTSNPDALLSIHQTNLHGSVSNLLLVDGTSNYDSFIIDRDANIGIGTSVIRNRFHIYQCEESSLKDAPVIGVYLNSNITSSILCGYDSNHISTVELAAKSLRIGENYSDSSNYSLDITDGPQGYSRARIPWIETNEIYSISDSIDFHESTLHASNMNLSNLTCQDTRVNYIFASNYEILGLQCFDQSALGTSMLHILSSNFWFTGTNVSFARDVSEIQMREHDYINDGKVNIVVDTNPNGGISRGLTVNGVGNTGVRISSSSLYSYYELANPSTSALIGFNTANDLFIKHNGDSYNKLNIAQNGIITINGANTIDSYGNMGIRLNNAAVANYPLQVNGQVYIQNASDNPVLFVDAGSGGNIRANVGIGTSAPSYSLHIEGNQYLTGKIGIGALPPTNGYIANVAGDVSVTGSIHSTSNIRAAGSIISASDARLKTNLERITGALDRIETLAGYTYNKIGSGSREVGLLAQDVIKVLPEAVHTDPDTGMMSIAYGNMVAILVEAIKELRGLIK